jgi:DNA-binding MarR family transcriptional regulator
LVAINSKIQRMDNTPPSAVDINLQPGHMIRRLQQIAVGIFHQETQDLDVTPVQYAVLQLVHNQPRADQRTIARSIALDTSTTAAVIDRLEARALLQRHASPDDRRLRLLTLTPSGEELLSQTIPHMEDAQKRILAPLTPQEQCEFMRLATLLATENNDCSRAPGQHGAVNSR